VSTAVIYTKSWLNLCNATPITLYSKVDGQCDKLATGITRLLTTFATGCSNVFLSPEFGKSSRQKGDPQAFKVRWKFLLRFA